MIGLKLLFSRYLRHRTAILVIAILFVGMLAAVMIFHADPGFSEDGDADYLMCKICALMPMMFWDMIPILFMGQENVGSRFMRAVPCAEKMYTVGVPLFSAIVPAAGGALTNIVYAVFILATGRDVCNIADMLILTGIVGGLIAVISCTMMSFRFGGVMFALFYLPFWVILIMSVTPGSQAAAYGFGLPLWAGALIAAGGSIAGALLGGVISSFAYRRYNFKETAYNSMAMK